MKQVKNDYYETAKPQLTKKAPWIPQNTLDKFPEIKQQNVLSRGYSLEREIKDIRQINMALDKPIQEVASRGLQDREAAQEDAPQQVDEDLPAAETQPQTALDIN